MSTQHTPGRAVLDAGDPIVRGEDGERIATCYRLFDGDRTKTPEVTSMANSRRLAACWNYCEGLDTEGMERAVEMKRPAKVFTDESTKKELELLAQRDALLAALKDVRSDLFMQIENRHGAKAASEYPSIIHAKVAIANVEGGAV